jgi:hypothetical protein
MFKMRHGDAAFVIGGRRLTLAQLGGSLIARMETKMSIFRKSQRRNGRAYLRSRGNTKSAIRKKLRAARKAHLKGARFVKL